MRPLRRGRASVGSTLKSPIISLFFRGYYDLWLRGSRNCQAANVEKHIVTRYIDRFTNSARGRNGGFGTETILLVCDCGERSADILERLHAAGYAVIGPVQNAATAMAVAAHTPPTLALIARPPNGRRNATEFAQDLMQTWGVRSWILDQEAGAASAWAAEDGRVAQIRDIIRSQSGATEARPTGALADDPIVAA